MEKLLEEMTNRGFRIALERDTSGGGNTYRVICRISSEGGVTKIGVGDTLSLAILRSISHIVATLENYLKETDTVAA